VLLLHGVVEEGVAGSGGAGPLDRLFAGGPQIGNQVESLAPLPPSSPQLFELLVERYSHGWVTVLSSQPTSPVNLDGSA
jgi:hypothetical protein